MLETIVDIQPYTPLLTGDEHIGNLHIQGLPKALTEEILDMHLKGLTESDRVPVHTTQGRLNDVDYITQPLFPIPSSPRNAKPNTLPHGNNFIRAFYIDT